MIEIRKANKLDAAHIASLGRITFCESHGNFFKDKNELEAYCDHTFSEKKIRNGFNNPDNIFWIAFVQGVPVGYTKLKLHSKSDFLKTENSCQLQKIYVLKDFISMKIGFGLQKLLLEEAKNRKFNEIWLSVYHKNMRAIDFYKKNDFKSLGTYDFNIGTAYFKLVVLSKKLFSAAGAE